MELTLHALIRINIKYMSIKIRDKKLIKSNTATKNGVVLEIFRNEKLKSSSTKLSDVLEFLPAGFVYKEETGMGATTLEINAERNSIIVEPIKITASSKAFKHNCLYVGSPTKFHDKKSPTIKEINEYVNDPSIKFKKIIVVADSFRKVLDALIENDDDIIRKFFIVIDEVDSFQLDSSYRKSMEECIDYYKLFPKHMRAMLSATKIEFSDPVLKVEPITYIKYDTPSNRKINVFTTNPSELEGLIIDTIVQCLKKNPNQKLFIAYNSVNGCYSLAEHLVSKNNISKENIKILCSSASKSRVKDFYNELDNDLLPAQVNFFTSSYFTGFDINESYHLISISGNRSKIISLSDRRFKQIAGRCRIGLLSETIIHDTILKNSIESVTTEEYIEAANEEIASLNCMKRHYENNSILKLFVGEVNEGLIKLLDDSGIGLVRQNIDKAYDISYLNIDSKIEGIRVRENLYLTHEALTNKLIKDGNSVKHILKTSSTKVIDKKVSQIDRDNQVVEIIEKLKNIKYPSEIDDLILDEKPTYFQEMICTDYKKLVDYLDPISTLEIIKSSIFGKRDVRMYKKVIISAIIQTLPNSHLITSRLAYYYPKNKKYTTDEIYERIDLYFGEINSFQIINTFDRRMKLFNTLCKTYRKRFSDGKDYYVIKGYNPFNFKVVKTKKSMNEDDLFSTVKSYF